MNFVYLKDFLEAYSLPSLIIAVIVAVLMAVSDKLLKDRLPTLVKLYAPFVLSVLIYFTYDIIFISGEFSFRSDVFYAGVLSGSLSAVFSGIISSIRRGEPISLNAVLLLIESILCELVPEKSLRKTALNLEKITMESGLDETVLATRLAETIKAYSDKALSDEEFIAVAKLIIEGINSLNTTE